MKRGSFTIRRLAAMVALLPISVLVFSSVSSETASAAPAFGVDGSVVTHQNTKATSITSGPLSTTNANDLIVAFIASDGPNRSAGISFSSVTGGGLTWRLRQRMNVQAGTAEIWQAVAPTVLTNVTFQATRNAGSYAGMMDIVAFSGADTAVDGAVGGANALTGAPNVSLTTTRSGSWVWGVGNDWTAAKSRTVGANQTEFDEFLPSAGDTYWTQSQTSPGNTAPSVISLTDTAPTTDRWDFASIEIIPAVEDVTPPSAPTNLTATASSSAQVNLSWTASTDTVGVFAYKVIRDGTQIGIAPSTTYVDSTVVPSTTYQYTVQAYDAAGNLSDPSNVAPVGTPAPAPPVISGVSVTTIKQTSATINWTTDVPASSQVQFGLTASYGGVTAVDQTLVRTHSQQVIGLSAATTYHFQVLSTNATGGQSASSDATFTTASASTPPAVSVTAPAPGAIVNGTTTVTASATDSSGIASVQFQLDGVDLGAKVTAAPYSISWNTTTTGDGPHTLTAIAVNSLGLSATSTAVAVNVSNGTGNPAQVGQWGPVIPESLISVHAALTTTGKILTWQGDFSAGGQQYVFDPVTGTSTQVPTALGDMFCAGQAVMADGRVMVIGGTSTSGGIGTKLINAFDANTNTWQPLAPMNFARWYATGTTLSDGQVMANSGYANANQIVTVPEIYDPTKDTWTAQPAEAHSMPIYPFIYQLPDGRILHAGGSEVPTATEILNLKTQSWSTVDSRVIDGASITNYAPGKFLKAGSAADSGDSGPSSTTAFTLDMNQPNPLWQPTNPMQFPRSFVNLTNLPDGTVLATGGGTDKSGYNDANAVLPAEVWNPATGTWTTEASMSVPRLYHSVALLLPDGRVFVSGSGGDAGVPDQKSIQIYSPSYLFKGPRPTITSAPTTVNYDSNVVIQTPDAASITSVSLIRTGSVTHSFDQNTRGMSLTFSPAAGGISVHMPVDGNTAPPGYYMLSIVNANGVPSVASMVQFPPTATPTDTTAPSAPGALTAVGGVGSTSLSWTTATDNVSVAGYNVYRSTTTGFAPSSMNFVGTTGSTSFVDQGLGAGTYYYLVTAKDPSGNVGPPSNEASAVVTAPSSNGVKLDVSVATHQAVRGTSITSPTFSTTNSDDLVLAFISTDGPAGTKQTIASVTGGGLVWKVRKVSNGQPGDAEIWEAVAPSPLTNVTVTATRASGSYLGAIEVAAFSGADTSVDGATAAASAVTGPPSLSLTTTRAGSWVWGVGNDYDKAVNRVAGPNQTLIDQFLATSGDTFWVQDQNNVTPNAGTSVTVNDTAPTTDRWNLALIEILAR